MKIETIDSRELRTINLNSRGLGGCVYVMYNKFWNH